MENGRNDKDNAKEENNECDEEEEDSMEIVEDNDIEIADVKDLPQITVGKNDAIDDYKDRFVRVQADFQNYQKRMAREFTDFKAYANSQLIDDLLSIIDDFGCALSQEEGTQKEFLKGFELIYKNFLGILQKEGLCEISAEKEKFDPFKHEAVDMIPTDDHPEHTIIEVVQKGYMFKDKVLRPAKVRVSRRIQKETECDD